MNVITYPFLILYRVSNVERTPIGLDGPNVSTKQPDDICNIMFIMMYVLNESHIATR